MTPIEYTKLRTQLTLHEGRRRYPYRCTAGKTSIGVGYNIDDRGLEPLIRAIGRQVNLTQLGARGLTDAEIDLLLTADILYFEGRVRAYFPAYDILDDIRQRVVLDFAFNLGKRALGFHKAIAALKNAIKQPINKAESRRLYYQECAYHMLHSLWASQVGDGAGKRFDRADRLAEMMATGLDYEA